MRPGYFVGIIILLLIIGEHLWKKKHSTSREIIILIIAAIAAGVFAGFALEWALSLFRTFMQANVGEMKPVEDHIIVASFRNM